MRWYRNAVSRRSAVLKVIRQGTKRLDSHQNKNMAGWQTAVLGRLPLCSNLCCLSGLHLPHSVPHNINSQCVDNSYVRCGAVSWMSLYQSHWVSFRHLCWDLVAPWMMVFRLSSENDGSGRWSEHEAVPCQGVSCTTMHVDRVNPP